MALKTAPAGYLAAPVAQKKTTLHIQCKMTFGAVVQHDQLSSSFFAEYHLILHGVVQKKCTHY